jgi:lysophospholipase L1-like esterase
MNYARLAALAAALTASAAAPPPPPWVATWAASQNASTPTAPGQYQNQTLRTVTHISIGGTSVRLRLSNQYGTGTLSFGDIHVALATNRSTINPATDHAVTFSGQSTLNIPAGAVAVSDPIAVSVHGGTDLMVSLYVTHTDVITQHLWALQTISIANGDQTSATTMTGATQTQSRPYIAGVDVAGATSAASIVALGDSITDGFFSDGDKNNRWPDLLGARLRGVYGNKVAIVNQGTSGNTLLGNSGPTASARFINDVLGQPGRRWMMLMIGINDIGLIESNPSQAPTLQTLIAGDLQLIAQAHEAGMQAIGMTLLPFEGSGGYSTAGEAVREQLNTWILTSGAFDGTVDTSTALENPANPQQLNPAYDSGDHLHPNEAGDQVIANTVNLSLFATN